MSWKTSRENNAFAAAAAKALMRSRQATRPADDYVLTWRPALDAICAPWVMTTPSPGAGQPAPSYLPAAPLAVLAADTRDHGGHVLGAGAMDVQVHLRPPGRIVTRANVV